MLPDKQNEKDDRGIPIQKVGITHLVYPLDIADRNFKLQSIVASIDLSVSLAHDAKGTHMSRFVEIVNELANFSKDKVKLLSFGRTRDLLNDICEAFDADRAEISINFPYFILKESPKTGKKGFVQHQAGFYGRLIPFKWNIRPRDYYGTLWLQTPVTTLCPCSKEISEKGAHNQRCLVDITVSYDSSKHMIWFEELAAIADESASAPIFSVLKREDEKYVTELAYDNPRFVEDMVREVSSRLVKDPMINEFIVSATSMESIHTHSAYARVAWKDGAYIEL